MGWVQTALEACDADLVLARIQHERADELLRAAKQAEREACDRLNELEQARTYLRELLPVGERKGVL